MNGKNKMYNIFKLLVIGIILLVSFSIASAMVNITEAAEISDSIEDNRIGFVIGSPDEIRMVAEVGGGWARPHPGPFTWQWIEPEKGRFDFTEADKWVKKAQEYNVALLATIWPYADWDQEKCHEANCEVSRQDEFYPRGGMMRGIPKSRGAPCSIKDYKDFVRKLVERYDGDGLDDMPGLKMPIKYWEILNEPEMNEPFLTFFNGTPEEYVEILKASKESIKSACSDCKIVQGGAAGIEPHMLTFWRKVFDLGGGNYFDIANIHYISMGDLNTLNVKAFRQLMQRKGINKPIWVTEAELRSESEAEASVKGAIDAGAKRVFFTRFEIGKHGRPRPGKYSKVYDKIVSRYK